MCAKRPAQGEALRRPFYFVQPHLLFFERVADLADMGRLWSMFSTARYADGQSRDGIVSMFFEQIVDGLGKHCLHGPIPVKAKLAQLLMGLGRQRGGDFLFSGPSARCSL